MTFQDKEKKNQQQNPLNCKARDKHHKQEATLWFTKASLHMNSLPCHIIPKSKHSTCPYFPGSLLTTVSCTLMLLPPCIFPGSITSSNCIQHHLPKKGKETCSKCQHVKGISYKKKNKTVVQQIQKTLSSIRHTDTVVQQIDTTALLRKHCE